MKLPYDCIVEHAFNLIDCIGLSNNPDNAVILWDELIEYLTVCGWTQFEFNNETISRIDSSWELILN